MSQDRMRRDNQRRDFAREATLHKLQEDAVLLANTASDPRVDSKRRMRILTEQQREIDAIAAMEAKHFAETARRVQEEQDSLLATELERLKHDQTVTDKKRQQLRETNSELRDLEAKLKAAYASKELHAQRAEKEVAVRTERETSLIVDRELDKIRAREEEAEQLRRQQIAMSNRVHQDDLLQQLSDQQQQQQQAYEEFIKEKLMIDEIVRRINDEDNRAREHEASRKQHTRKEMEDFKAQQERWRQQESAELAKENERIMQFAQQQTHRADDARTLRVQRAEQREAVVSHIARKVESERAAREELERVQQELYEEERLEQDRQRAMAEIEARIRQRLAMQRNQAEDLTMRQRQKEREREEEEEFRLAMMEKFAIDDRLEQMNAQKRRQRQLEHKRAVEALLDERRARFHFEKEQQQRQVDQARTDDAARRDMIEAERQSLLREHAHKLLGFLPKGVLRDARDVEMLGDGFKAVYAPPRVADDDDY